jgi:hypothetical protein
LVLVESGGMLVYWLAKSVWTRLWQDFSLSLKQDPSQPLNLISSEQSLMHILLWQGRPTRFEIFHLSSLWYNYARIWVSAPTHGRNSQQRITLEFRIMQVHLSRYNCCVLMCTPDLHGDFYLLDWARAGKKLCPISRNHQVLVAPQSCRDHLRHLFSHGCSAKINAIFESRSLAQGV